MHVMYCVAFEKDSEGDFAPRVYVHRVHWYYGTTVHTVHIEKGLLRTVLLTESDSVILPFFLSLPLPPYIPSSIYGATYSVAMS